MLEMEGRRLSPLGTILTGSVVIIIRELGTGFSVGQPSLALFAAQRVLAGRDRPSRSFVGWLV